LIECLVEDYPECPECPELAAEEWTEAEIRAYFSSNGEIIPKDETVIPGQPGGGSWAHCGTDEWKRAPEAYHFGLANNASVDNYQHEALAAGIPLRPHGLFPPGDAVLATLSRTRGLRPFQKCCVGGAGTFELVEDSWAVGDAACKRGIDLRYWFDVSTAGNPSGNRLVGAVRFSDNAAIASGFWTAAHGGAIETVLDEITAEIVKISQASTAVTIDAKFQMKKACPLNTSLLCEAVVKEVTSEGLRIHTEGLIKDTDGVVYATATAQLVDYGRIRRDTNTMSPHMMQK